MTKASLLTISSSDYLKSLAGLKGIPYRWDGKDMTGVDCSGAVTVSYMLAASGPGLLSGQVSIHDIDVRNTHNCEVLITECELVAPIRYEPGLLAFYGPSAKSPKHVMTVVKNEFASNGYLTAFGACGGNQYCRTPDDAERMVAYVQFRPKIAYRPDFLGCYRWSRLTWP